MQGTYSQQKVQLFDLSRYTHYIEEVTNTDATTIQLCYYD